MHGMPLQTHQVGTSAVIWQRAEPGSSAVKPLSSYLIQSNGSSFNIRAGACLCLLHNQPQGQGLVKKEQEHPDRWFGHTPVLDLILRGTEKGHGFEDLNYHLQA